MHRAKNPFLVELLDFHVIDRKEFNCADNILYRSKENNIIELDKTYEVALMMEYARYGTLDDFLKTETDYCKGKIL